ncbi:hypothetical protein DFH94DRAFT_734630 [Russula ochroleuca]|uniref:Uncharacterized protein n=1 Tax=Russula ochroleuca TaxID=152965 RepID=A0A9P5MZ21_9AGAM|nr:hypothetical protein DFH94DRAFT_734630 [Russula ochroleuca]
MSWRSRTQLLPCLWCPPRSVRTHLSRYPPPLHRSQSMPVMLRLSTILSGSLSPPSSLRCYSHQVDAKTPTEASLPMIAPYDSPADMVQGQGQLPDVHDVYRRHHTANHSGAMSKFPYASRSAELATYCSIPRGKSVCFCAFLASPTLRPIHANNPGNDASFCYFCVGL